MLFGRKSETRSDPEPAPEKKPEPQRALKPLPPAVRKPAADAGTGNGARSQSFIDASLTIMGDLHTDGDVQLDGRVCGNVSCAQLIVGRDATITGAVTAEQAVIRGTITGTIRSPVVILQDTARVESEITYTVLAIDDGATFEGAARRSEHPLEEVDAASPLEELQRITLSGAHGNGNGANGTGPHADAAVSHDAAPAGASGYDPAVVQTVEARRKSSDI